MLKTIILERIDSLGLENFKSFSKVKEFYDKPRNEILKVIRNFEIIVIKSTIKVDEEFLKHSKKIKVVARAGTGLDNINQKLLKKKNVKLFSIPKGNTVAAAEYIMCMILMLAKKISLIEDMIKNDDFSRHNILSMQLDSSTVGIIGLGNVGMEVVNRLVPFGCRVLGFDKKKIDKEKIKNFNIKLCKKLSEVLKKSDIIVLCATLNEKSRKIINKENYKTIKKGCYLVNCARAELIDQDILLKGLNEKVFEAAALDLISPEPTYAKKKQNMHPLFYHPRVFYSPHVAALTDISQKKIANLLANKVKKYLTKDKM